MGVMTATVFGAVIASLLAYPVLRRFGPRGFLFPALVLVGAFAAMLWLAIPVLTSGGVVTHAETAEWIPQLSVTLGFRMDTLSALLSLLVTGVGALVLWYCRRYFEEDEDGVARFGATFLAFAGAMLGLVVADDVYLLFVFWEATTVLSFLLIGHYGSRWMSRASAMQALTVTTLGGLAMLVGFVILATEAGTSSLAAILDAGLSGPSVTVAVYLLVVGALSKSAIFPFHFWLPSAMAAPTPVSAYLHAAAMVKAGVYLIARLVPAYGESVPWLTASLVIVGGITMIHGGIRALRQFDLKLVLAYGTVSQLGLLVMVLGLGLPGAQFAGIALLFAHALAKAPLFLIVGIIDHRTGTRDLRKISGLGAQTPALATLAAIACASMIGLPPLIGFVAKESLFTELTHLVAAGDPLVWITLVVGVLGSALTVGYSLRFFWGAFSRKPSVADCGIAHRQHGDIMLAPFVLVALALSAGLGAPFVDTLIRPVLSPEVAAGPESLALWHGFTPALGLSALVVALGALAFLGTKSLVHRLPAWPERLTAARNYWQLTRGLDRFAVGLTGQLQRGSLPFYLSAILLVYVLALGFVIGRNQTWPEELVWLGSVVQLPIAIVMIIASIAAVRAKKRFQAIVLVGFTGYGMAAMFALHGAPDLALTQGLVETVTLIAFVLVIRRLPARIGNASPRPAKIARALLGVAVGAGLAAVAVIALGARIAEPISLQLPDLAYSGGHGKNVVNVMLVDIRGWDTMGELSVIIAAATGVASLVFLSTRQDTLPRLTRRDAQSQVRQHLLRVADPNDATERGTWLLAGREMEPGRRSIILEVVVRLMFHALLILSVYLLLTGHNTPGGGFAGGLVAGMALVARYLAGGRKELGATVQLDAGKILGAGLLLATLTALAPMFFGQAALSSSWFELDLGIFGEISFVTSTLFDVGVYLVVIGLILDVLRSLGAQIDRDQEDDLANADDSTAPAPLPDPSGQSGQTLPGVITP